MQFRLITLTSHDHQSSDGSTLVGRQRVPRNWPRSLLISQETGADLLVARTCLFVGPLSASLMWRPSHPEVTFSQMPPGLLGLVQTCDVDRAALHDLLKATGALPCVAQVSGISAFGNSSFLQFLRGQEPSALPRLSDLSICKHGALSKPLQRS